MAKKPSLDEAPTRANRASGKKLDAQRDDTALVTIAHDVPLRQKRMLQILAIETGRQQKDLLSEALDLLEEKHGSTS